MTKKVVYNGGTKSHGGSFTSPTELIVGKEYEVVYLREYAWHTEYYLSGIEGKFNSVWFDDVKEVPTFLAITRDHPKVGWSLACYRTDYRPYGPPRWFECSTSTVLKVHKIEKNVYRVETMNSIYIVYVS